MKWSERRERFRAVLNGGTCVYPGSVFDPISARIAEEVGFEIGMFAGSVASMTVLGAPDLIVLTLSEFADQAGRICRASSLPLMVDADHGYGNALNVQRTVEELEIAGISGMSIEDTALPYVHGSGGKTALLSVEEGVGKMKAALSGRVDSSLSIFGRTSALAFTGLDDCIKRVKAYDAAGVDAIFLVGGTEKSDLEAVAAETDLPIMLGGLPESLRDADWLASLGVRICLTGHQPFAASVQATYNTLKALRDGTAPKDLQGVASGDLMKRVTRDADYARWTKDFLEG